MGMMPVDTLDSIILRSAFSRIFNTKSFRYMAYALSGAAVTIASLESYGSITSKNILPEWTGPVLAASIISVSFGYAFVTRKKASIDNHHIKEKEENNS